VSQTLAARLLVPFASLAPIAPILWASTALAGDLTLQPKAGAPLTGLSPAELELFETGRQLYVTPLSPLMGLGPIFNKSNCGSCHSTPLGGWGSISVTHFGYEKKGEYVPLDHLGGSLLQGFSISGGCSEFVPIEANFTTNRVTNSSMAFGLVEAIPDAAIAANADPDDLDGDGISGRVNWVVPLETPDGPPRAGRFGWKAQVATVLTFSADASRNEMGLTNRLIPTENAPNGNVELLAQCDEIADPEDLADEEGFDFIDRVTHFQRLLGPPPQTPKSGMAGEVIFGAIGCAACHIPEWTASSAKSLESAIRGKTFRPYSDFLIHEMGLLADGLPQEQAGAAEFRTPTLWNLRTRNPMLHDGRVSGGIFADRVASAIEAHGPFGEGAASATAFAKLPPDEREKLIAFLGSLGRLEFDMDGDNQVTLGDLPEVRDCFGNPGVTPDDPCAVADVGQDGDVDAEDVELFRQALGLPQDDCNRNGVPDLLDLVAGTSKDADFDGRPDECVACPGDLDGDSAVGAADLAMLLAAWGTPGADLDADGTTAAGDLTLMLSAWGNCP
jgi:hypothetical protein